MKKFIMIVVMATVGFGASLTAQVSGAGKTKPNPDHDLREGTFQGNWCGSSAEFTIKKQKGEDWKFEGTVKIFSTRQVDPITIEQLGDNSLHMVRFLSGQFKGKTQVTQTHPPETFSSGNKMIVNFPTRRTFGYGARTAGFLKMPVQK